MGKEYGRTKVKGLFSRGTRALYRGELYSKETTVEELCRFLKEDVIRTELWGTNNAGDRY